MTINKSLAALTALVLLTSLAACSVAQGGVETEPTSSTDSVGLGIDAEALLADYNITPPATVQELIEQFESQALADRPDGLLASVQIDALVLSSGDNEVSLATPDDEFHLSIAPYLTETHECFYHSLTTCAGELGSAQMHVTITDDGSGEVLLDRDLTTYENGYFDVWLPTDRDITVTIDDGTHTATASLGTYDDDPTCVTTIQLT
jgi:hypothetical protein